MYPLVAIATYIAIRSGTVRTSQYVAALQAVATVLYSYIVHG